MVKSFLKEFKVPSLYESGFENFLYDFEEALGITKEKFYIDYEAKRELLSCVSRFVGYFNSGEEVSLQDKIIELNLFEESFIDDRVSINKLLFGLVKNDTYYVYLKGSYMGAPESFKDIQIYIGFLKVEREPSNLKIVTNLFGEEYYSFLQDPTK